MIRFLFLATLVFFSISLQAQPPKGVKPDYYLIKKLIENRKSVSFYPKLLKRLQEKDTTLTKDDFHNLYYGYSLQKDYNPYSRNANEEELGEYLSKESLTPSEQVEFIRLANKLLNQDPFNFQVMHALAQVYEMNGNMPMAKKVSFLLNNFISAIISTGDGLSCETGFHVITINHEYLILSVFDVESQMQSLIDNCDYLSFEKGRYKIDGLYFDISKMMESMLGKN